MKQLLLSNRARLAFTHDIFVSGLSIPIALYLRMGDTISTINSYDILFASLIFIGVSIPIYIGLGMYRGFWRFASMEDIITVIKAVTLASLLFLPILFFFSRLEWLPRSFPIINWLLLILMLGGSRAAYRILRDRKTTNLLQKSNIKRLPVLLIGTGPEADIFIRENRAAEDSKYNVVGILCNHKKQVSLSIQGIPILGTIDDFSEDILRKAKQRPSKLILTRTDFKPESLRPLIEKAQKIGLTISRASRVSELKEGTEDNVTDNIRPIAIEDLLGRPQNTLDLTAMRNLIKHKRILITGAGGSIGSELVRQIAAQSPSEIILLEASEYQLYLIDQEISNRFPNLTRHTILADIRDAQRIHDVFSRLQPEIVFHAAAFKHVPLVEANPMEGILTNLVGSRIIADACYQFNVSCMVQISTDKAVNPTNVMGASKRLAECYIQALDPISRQNNKTKYVVVRFGNVLGSTGSVVPLFQKQLAKGGPLTVTHPEVNRFFMTIREAVELVLQASTLGIKDPESAGKIYVLEMGEAVKIADLARQVILLAGKTPEKDIEIVYTGLRPGEKLYEEVLHDEETQIKTEIKNILLASPRTYSFNSLTKQLDEIAEAAYKRDRATTLKLLQKLVPEYEGDKHTLTQSDPTAQVIPSTLKNLSDKNKPAETQSASHPLNTN